MAKFIIQNNHTNSLIKSVNELKAVEKYCKENKLDFDDKIPCYKVNRTRYKMMVRGSNKVRAGYDFVTHVDFKEDKEYLSDYEIKSLGDFDVISDVKYELVGWVISKIANNSSEQFIKIIL